MTWAPVLAAAVGLGLAGCEAGQVAAPVPTGVQWMRITTSAGASNPFFPSWRGDSIVFMYFNAQGKSRMATTRPDGTTLVYLPAPAAWCNDRAPRWVDDTTIVFASTRSAPSSANANTYFDLWFYTTTTNQLRQLADTPELEWDPAPRPGGDGLVYTEGATPVDGRIVLVPHTGLGQFDRYYLTPSTLKASEPDWDPTGQRVCFSADSSNGSHHLWVLSMTDTIPTQITTGPYHDYSPRWSPDGTRILFTSDRTGRNGLWTVTPDGGSLVVVAFEDAGRTMYTPCWSPDGTRVVLSSDGHRYPRALWVLSNLP